MDQLVRCLSTFFRKMSTGANGHDRKKYVRKYTLQMYYPNYGNLLELIYV